MLTHMDGWHPQHLSGEAARAVLEPALARQEAVVLQCRVELMAAQQALSQALVLLMRLEAEHSRLSEDGGIRNLGREWEDGDAEPRCAADTDAAGRPGRGAGAGGSGLV